MQHIAPLVQTILWVILVAGALWRFNKPIHDLLTALARRIEAGSTLKAGPFEIGDHVRPQTTSEQAQKLTADTIEASKTSVDANGLEPNPNQIEELITASQYLHAEDLALRVVQSETGTVLTRQVTVGDELEVDGLIMNEGRLILVEVKYIQGFSSAESIAKVAIERLTDGIYRDRKLRNVSPSIMLVLVFRNRDDISRTQHKLDTIAKSSRVSVTIRSYWFEDLQRRFEGQIQ